VAVRAPRALSPLLRPLPLLVLAAGVLAACGRSASRGAARTTAGEAPDPIAQLRPYEEALHREIDLARPPSAETGHGADPWSLVRMPSSRWVGILRGRSAVVLLDDELRELARAPAPRSPTGLAVGPDGDVWISGELSPSIARYEVRGDALEKKADFRLPGVFGIRDIAVTRSGAVWALDDRGGRLVGLPAPPRGGAPARRAGAGAPPAVLTVTVPTCHGAAQLEATERHLVVDCVLDHALMIFTTDADGAVTPGAAPARVVHDGPIWAFDAREGRGELFVVTGGVEDRPLDRRDGFFGYVDSFVHAYRVEGGRVTRLAAVNVAEHGVITPKAIAIEKVSGTGDDATVEIFAGAYGSATGARLSVGVGLAAPRVLAVPLVPGLRGRARVDRTGGDGPRYAMADPLLDAWVSWDGATFRVVPVPDAAAAPRDAMTRLGEALFFTTLMAPDNTSAGAHSRFTCETCHFEGYVDGRTHHTGRDEIHATTKPLVGLLGNRPHFTRALDPDLSTIAHAEFRVAGAGNGKDPFFPVEPRDVPWLAHLGVDRRAEPLDLRRALMRFLASFSHRPNPASLGRTVWDDAERRGAALFRERCASCHAARLAADDPASEVPFDRWESTILSEEAPIVWGRAGYEKTGVVPYVHPDGARPPSLRRLAKKYPYFTSGSARSLDDVLDRARFASPGAGSRFFHDAAPPGTAALGDDDKRALRAFLELL